MVAQWVTTNWGSTVLMVTTETPKSDVIVEFGICDDSVIVTCLHVVVLCHRTLQTEEIRIHLVNLRIVTCQ